MKLENSPVILMILSGFGVAPDSDGNAISQAEMPNWKKLVHSYPAMTLKQVNQEPDILSFKYTAAELANLSLGTGRNHFQALSAINNKIENGSFFNSKILLSVLDYVQIHKSNIHLVGLLGEGKINASQKHLYALLDFFNIREPNQQIFIHGILDGVDTPKDSGKKNVEELVNRLKKMGNKAKLASLSGRYYALDRNNYWDRTKRVYEVLVGKKDCLHSKSSPVNFLENKYEEKIFDNDIEPTIFSEAGSVKPNDAIIFFNVRPDFVRQLSQSLSLPSFSYFDRGDHPSNLFVSGFLRSDEHSPQVSIFPDNLIEKSLGQVLAAAGLKQARLADVYKFSFVTHFFDGLKDESYDGEDWILVAPEDNSDHFKWLETANQEIKKIASKFLEKDDYSFLVLDFSLIDIAARTGNIQKTILACEQMDKILGEVTDYVLAKGGTLVVTSDCGNGEQIIDVNTEAVNRRSTLNPVPVLIVSEDRLGLAGKNGDPPEGDLSLMPPVGTLADIAPTILELLKIEPPEEMTGKSLL